MSTVGLSERDSKETLFVKEEVTNDIEVFGEVEVDVEGSQKEPLSSILKALERLAEAEGFPERAILGDPLTNLPTDSGGRQLESHTNHALLRCDRTHALDVFETPGGSESARWNVELPFHLFNRICYHAGTCRM